MYRNLYQTTREVNQDLISMFHQPLHQIYPQLSAIQQQAIRRMLVERFKLQITRLVLDALGRPARPETALAHAEFSKQFIADPKDDNPITVRAMFELARENNCNSILDLTAQLLAIKYDVADEATREGDLNIRKMSLDDSTSIYDTVIGVFPDLDKTILLKAIQRNREGFGTWKAETRRHK